MQVRNAVVKDAEKIAALNEEVFFYTAPAEKIAGLIAANSEDHIILVACEGEELLGCIHCLRLDNILRADSWEVYSLAMTENARGQGGGGMLLDEAEKQAAQRGAKVMELTSGVERLAAHRFYLRHGYTDRKEVKHFVKDLCAK